MYIVECNIIKCIELNDERVFFRSMGEIGAGEGLKTLNMCICTLYPKLLSLKARSMAYMDRL